VKSIIAIATLAMITGFCFGTYYGQETVEPAEITRTEYIGLPGEIVQLPPKVVKVEKEIVVEVEKETVKEVMAQPRHFVSVGEAEGWIAKHQLPLVLIADSSGTINLNNPRSTPAYDCDDYAEEYVKMALEDGYIMYEVPVANGRIWGVKVSTAPGNHVGNMVKINGVYYYIESSPGPAQYRLTRILSAD